MFTYSIDPTKTRVAIPIEQLQERSFRANSEEKSLEIKKTNAQLQQIPVAIVGITSIFRQSKNLQEYWEKIIRKVGLLSNLNPGTFSPVW